MPPASSATSASTTAARYRGALPLVRRNAAAASAASSSAVPSTSSAPILLVVRNAPAPGTWSNPHRSARPNGLGAAGGNSPTMIGTAIASRASPTRRTGPRTTRAASPAATGRPKLSTTTTGLRRYAAYCGSQAPFGPLPYSGHWPRPRSASAYEVGPKMPSSVSELSTTTVPARSANSDGTSQYAETATTSAAHRASTARICRQRSPSARRSARTITGTARSWSSGTTPAFIPVIAKNVSATAAGQR